jgi:hypothetical protein
MRIMKKGPKIGESCKYFPRSFSALLKADNAPLFITT